MFGRLDAQDIDSLRTLVGALSSSNTLKSIRVGIDGVGYSDDKVSIYMRTYYINLISYLRSQGYLGLQFIIFVDVFTPHVFSMFCFCQHCSVNNYL